MNLKELINEKKFRFLFLIFILVVPFEIMSLFSIHLPLWIELPVFLVILFAVGKNVFKSGIESLLHLNFSNINLLMTIAVFGALYLREFEEGVIIIVLFALSEVLEEVGIEKSQKSLEDLVNKSPKSVLIKENEEKIPIEAVKAGQIIIVKPGDSIPLDGKIMEGKSLVDESAITGEPMLQSKFKGDKVYAGTQNSDGYLEVMVTKTVKDTTLAKIIDITYEATQKKSRSVQFIEKFARYYTPTVVVGAGLLVIIPVFFFRQPFNPWFASALTFLIISCPCALVISSPIAIFSALGNASKKGILIKGGKYIEEMGKIKAIAFDKTRTLTEGDLVVSDVVAFNGFSKQEVLACAAGMEMLSEHPLARSIIKEVRRAGLTPHSFADFQSISGKGLKGSCTVCTDTHHCLGNIKFITKEHNVEDQVVKQVEAFEKQGKTTIVMSDNGNVKGVIGITDKIRKETKSTIEKLKGFNIISILLTGDNYAAARFVGQNAGISQIKAELLPEAKVEELHAIIKQYHHVSMVGDGVNDAPALATSSVGIAMGAIGSDIAVENADISLMNNNLTLIPYLVGLGKKTDMTIRINTAAAVSIKFIFLVLALFGVSNLAFAIFADVGVSVVVVINSLNLFNFHPINGDLT